MFSKFTTTINKLPISTACHKLLISARLSSISSSLSIAALSLNFSSNFQTLLASTNYSFDFKTKEKSKRLLHSNMLPLNKLVKDSTSRPPTKAEIIDPTTNKVIVNDSVSNIRTLSTYNEKELSERMFRNLAEFEKLGSDFQIPTPWGHIACKEFGNRSGKKVLMTHGWLDNLNSWSQLVPELLRRDPNLHIVTFDEPGCGLSSPKPNGMYYEPLGTVVDMRRIVNYMKWEHLALIGHSKGAFYSFIYAAIYPDTISQLFACDLIGPEINMNKDIAEHIDQRVAMDINFVNDPTGKRFNKVYAYDKALERFLDSRPIFGMKRCAAEVLLKRGMRQVSDGYIFNRDVQWNFYAISLFPSRAKILELLNNLSCDIQLIIASESPFKVPNDFWNDYKELYKRNSGLYEDIIIPGKHYIHMDEAEIIADKIFGFMKKSNEMRKLDKNKL